MTPGARLSGRKRRPLVSPEYLRFGLYCFSFDGGKAGKYKFRKDLVGNFLCNYNFGVVNQLCHAILLIFYFN